MSEEYLNDLDVTQSVRVSDPEAVKTEVLSLFSLNFPGVDCLSLEKSFDLFTQLYQGRLIGYHPCDTLYHDLQHSLDIALTTARLLRGYHKVHGSITNDQILLGIVTALFHDAGYIRHKSERNHENGADYTSIHVSRSAEFMLQHLPKIGLADIAKRAAQIVHLTGYEIEPQLIQPELPSDRLIGDIVATADLITQIADRCYLEKCRDRLFPELILGADANQTNNAPVPIYRSAEELLLNTPSFYRLHVRHRLEHHFKSVFQYTAAYFNGPNYYMLSIDNNIQYLEKLIERLEFDLLRRDLPKNHGEKVFPYYRLDLLLNPGRQLKSAAR